MIRFVFLLFLIWTSIVLIFNVWKQSSNKRLLLLTTSKKMLYTIISFVVSILLTFGVIEILN